MSAHEKQAAPLFVLTAASAMGAALGGAVALEEVIALVGLVVVGAVGTATVGVLLVDALQGCDLCPSPQEPDVVEDGVALTRNFKLETPGDIQALTLVSAKLKGQDVKNSSVPYQFTMVVGKAFNETRQRMVYHAGLLIVGKFAVETEEFDYMLADRFNDAVEVTFYKDKVTALGRFRRIKVNIFQKSWKYVCVCVCARTRVRVRIHAW